MRKLVMALVLLVPSSASAFAGEIAVFEIRNNTQDVIIYHIRWGNGPRELQILYPGGAQTYPSANPFLPATVDYASLVNDPNGDVMFHPVYGYVSPNGALVKFYAFEQNPIDSRVFLVTLN